MHRPTGDATRRASNSINRIIIFNVFSLPQTVADKIHTTRCDSARPSSCIVSGGVNWLLKKLHEMPFNVQGGSQNSVPFWLFLVRGKAPCHSESEMYRFCHRAFVWASLFGCRVQDNVRWFQRNISPSRKSRNAVPNTNCAAKLAEKNTALYTLQNMTVTSNVNYTTY